MKTDREHICRFWQRERAENKKDKKHEFLFMFYFIIIILKYLYQTLEEVEMCTKKDATTNNIFAEIKINN